MVNAILKPNWGGLRIFSMVRIASVFPTMKHSLAGGALLLLAGCAGGQAADVQAVEVASQSDATLENFTTVGKPTKTIETPWGPREVYDPAQDEEVRAAFLSVFKRGDVTFGDISRYNGITAQYPNRLTSFRKYTAPQIKNKPDARILKTARQIQYYDILRLGCKDIEEFPNQKYGKLFFSKPCEDSELGSKDMSVCEMSSYVVNHRLPSPYVTKSVNPEEAQTFREPGDNRVLTEIPDYTQPLILNGNKYDIHFLTLIGVEGGSDEKSTVDLLNHARCIEWHGSEFFKNR